MERVVVRRRRAPKYTPFAVTGAVVGAVLGIVIALSRPAESEFTIQTVAGYFAVILGLVGALAGLAVALFVERRH